MRGFAVIENEADGIVVVWQTSQVEPQRAVHTNAVRIDHREDPEVDRKLRSLTRGRIVLLTEGSDRAGLPVEVPPLKADDIALMVRETEDRQAQILEAVRGYGKRSRTNVIRPNFAASPKPEDFIRHRKSPVEHTLQTANYLAAAWSAWLVTEEERRRRTVQPRTGKTPWMMPEELNDPAIAILPPRFADRASTETTV
jgi:hypothetical protein